MLYHLVTYNQHNGSKLCKLVQFHEYIKKALVLGPKIIHRSLLCPFIFVFPINCTVTLAVNAVTIGIISGVTSTIWNLSYKVHAQVNLPLSKLSYRCWNILKLFPKDFFVYQVMTVSISFVSNCFATFSLTTNIIPASLKILYRSSLFPLMYAFPINCTRTYYWQNEYFNMSTIYQIWCSNH